MPTPLSSYQESMWNINSKKPVSIAAICYRFQKGLPMSNCKFTFATYDKEYMRMLRAVVEATDGENKPYCTYKDIKRIAYPNKKCPTWGIDQMKRLLVEGLVSCRYRNTELKYNPTTYSITTKGRHLIAKVLPTKEVCEFICFAKKFSNFNEWMLEAAIQAHAEFTTREFYHTYIAKWFVDYSVIGKHIRNKLEKLPFLKEYIKYVQQEKS